MAHSNPDSRRPGALLALLLAAVPVAGTAQTLQNPLDSDLPISLDAESSDYDRRADLLVFRGLTITQGDMSISADDARANRLDFDDARWEFSGNVRVSMGDAELAADEATLSFRNHRLAVAVARGSPARFEDRGAASGLPIRGRAGEVEYDLENATVRLLHDAWLSEGANEISGASLVYNLLEERVLAEGDGDESRVRITITPPGRGNAEPEESDGDAEP